MESNLPTGTINIYGCGGAGINIAYQFEQSRSSQNKLGFAQVNPIYIDTSRTNINQLKGTYPDEATYIFSGVDGSGKVRKENAQQITKSVLDILIKHPPADLNIVVSSSSGGSGSVIAPSLVSELLNKEHNVIVLCVGSSDSLIEIENTVKTLKSYESIAKLRNKPVVMRFYENTRGRKLEDINRDFFKDIVYLSALFSKQNIGLDSADLRNWLNYNRATSFEPKLVHLNFNLGLLSDGSKEHEDGIITIATLAKEGHDTAPGVIVEYRCYGIINVPEENIKMESSLHFVVTENYMDKIYSEFDKIRHNLLEVQKSRVSKASILAIDDDTETNGLVL
jgi:hypothetical protein